MSFLQFFVVLKLSSKPFFVRKKNCIAKLLALRSSLKVSLLALGPFCPLPTILMCDLAGYGRPLQKVMAVWHIFFNI